MCGTTRTPRIILPSIFGWLSERFQPVRWATAESVCEAASRRCCQLTARGARFSTVGYYWHRRRSLERRSAAQSWRLELELQFPKADARTWRKLLHGSAIDPDWVGEATSRRRRDKCWPATPHRPDLPARISRSHRDIASGAKLQRRLRRSRRRQSPTERRRDESPFIPLRLRAASEPLEIIIPSSCCI